MKKFELLNVYPIIIYLRNAIKEKTENTTSDHRNIIIVCERRVRVEKSGWQALIFQWIDIGHCTLLNNCIRGAFYNSCNKLFSKKKY